MLPKYQEPALKIGKEIHAERRRWTIPDLPLEAVIFLH